MPSTMALPVIGERVQLIDGDEGTVMARSQTPGRLAWRVQDGDPEHGTGWSRWIELHEIAGYLDATTPAEAAGDDLAAHVLNAAINWHAATQAGGGFLDACVAADALHDAVRAYMPLVGQ